MELNNNCTDLPVVHAELPPEDCPCYHCDDCREGCCPLWVKMCTEVDNNNAPQLGSPTGGTTCWSYREVLEAVEQAWVNPDDHDNIHFGPHVFRGYRESLDYVEMTAVCNPNTAANLAVTTNTYINGINTESVFYSTESYCSSSPILASGCLQVSQYNPVWLGGFLLSRRPSLVYDRGDKLYNYDPSAYPGDDPPCLTESGYNCGCSGNPDFFAAVYATWGGNFSASRLITALSNTGSCRHRAQVTSVNPSGNRDLVVPVGVQLFPGFDVTLLHPCDGDPPTTVDGTDVDMYAGIDCNGVVTAYVSQRDQPGCNWTDSCGGYPNPDCVSVKTQFGSFTSAPGQTLPYSGSIPTTKNTSWSTPGGLINQSVPGPPVSFTLDWIP